MRGVYTIDDLRLRCVVDDLTECWTWKGAFTQGVGAVWLPALGKTRTIRSASMFLTGNELKPGQRVYLKCTNKDCCNPDHMRPMTPKQFGRAQAASGRLKGRPERMAQCIRLARQRSQLTEELVREIRASDETGVAISARTGISRTVISRVRNNLSWKAHAMPGASVFAWAANDGARRSA